MNSARSIRFGLIAAAAALAAVAWTGGFRGRAVAAQAEAQASAPGGQAAALQARMRARAQQMLQMRLDEAAARLQIRASQEPAWNAFSEAIRALAQPPAIPPAAPPGNRPEDAATLLHRQAAAAMARAQRLMQVADATGRLRAALDPNQREVLDQIVRERLQRERAFGRRGMRGMMRRGVGAAGFGPGREIGPLGPPGPPPPPDPDAAAP